MKIGDYYVYRHFDRRGKSRFVGLGRKNSAYKLTGRTKAHSDFLKFMQQMHGDVKQFVEILHSDLTKEQAEQLKAYEMDRRRYEHHCGLFNVSNPSPYSGYVNSSRRVFVEPPEFFRA